MHFRTLATPLQRAGSTDVLAERVVFWSPIASELAVFPGVTPPLQFPAQLSQ